MLNISDSAVNYIKKYAADNADNVGNKPFRVYVEGGGCSGFQYGYTFDDKKEGDEELVFDSLTVVVDNMSMNFLEGCTLDYVSNISGSGFVVVNPKATHKCGCGQSFGV